MQVFKYVLFDVIAAVISWGLLYLYRKSIIENTIVDNFKIIFYDIKLYLGLVIVPVFWVGLYAISGTYRKIFRKSRLRELGQTLLQTLIGCLIIFFVLILDDVVNSYKNYYSSFVFLFTVHFSITFLFRFIITTTTARKIQQGKIGFNTLIIGSNGNAVDIYKEIKNQEISSGNKFVGFVYVDKYETYKLDEFLPNLGSYQNLNDIIVKNKIEEVIIAIESSEHKIIEDIITKLEDVNVVIKIIPGMHDILLGSVKMTGIFHVPLIQIYPDLLPAWQQFLKRFLDIVISSLCLIILSPVFVFVAVGVKLSSKGPIFYSHQRIGLHGKPFVIYKFRSMYVDAEKNGPQLSSKNDPRITPFGKFLRKVRLDEIPQFYNVLIGEMSLVGPRPERQYYIDQIIPKAPHYKLLLKVKPGITSWGQVKYGYAENVEQMIERLKYDILYIENMSLTMDLKILIYTALIILQGRGK